MASLNTMNTLNANETILYGTSISDLYATIFYVIQIVAVFHKSALDDGLAPLISKDIASNGTLQSHITLIDTNTTGIATHTNDIAVLNTKQTKNFAGINDISTNVPNKYQTNSQLTTTLYNKTEIDTSLGKIIIQ